MKHGANRGLYGRRHKHLKGRLKNGYCHESNGADFDPKPKTEDEIREETAEVIARIMGK